MLRGIGDRPTQLPEPVDRAGAVVPAASVGRRGPPGSRRATGAATAARRQPRASSARLPAAPAARATRRAAGVAPANRGAMRLRQAAAAPPRRRAAAGRRDARRTNARRRWPTTAVPRPAPAAAVISAAAAASRCKQRRRGARACPVDSPGPLPVARSCAARRRQPAGCGLPRPSGAARGPRPADTRTVSRSPPKMRGGSTLRLDQLQQAAAEHQQVADQVAAVHRRDVQRRQRLERTRVVPVVEVAAVALHPGQGAERLLRAVEQPAGGAIAEVAGGQVRQQRHADVGRAGARRDDPGRMLLEIVGRQPVLFRRDEDLEVAPGPPGQLSQKDALLVGQADRRRGQRPAQPPGDDRRDEPQPEQRPGDQAAGRGRHRIRSKIAATAMRRPDPHGPEEARQIGAGAAVGVAGGLPLQQSSFSSRAPAPAFARSHRG